MNCKSLSAAWPKATASGVSRSPYTLTMDHEPLLPSNCLSGAAVRCSASSRSDEAHWLLSPSPIGAHSHIQHRRPGLGEAPGLSIFALIMQRHPLRRRPSSSLELSKFSLLLYRLTLLAQGSFATASFRAESLAELRAIVDLKRWRCQVHQSATSICTDISQGSLVLTLA